MTAMIKDALKAGVRSYEYASLLHNYGLWARYFGAVGYIHQGSNSETYIIDDNCALVVDRAMQRLKDTRPNIFKLVTMYYVNGMDEIDILSVMKQTKTIRPHREYKQGFYSFDPAVDCALRYTTAKTIRELISLGERIVFGWLEEMNEKL